jgi:hypothetical protein
MPPPVKRTDLDVALEAAALGDLAVMAAEAELAPPVRMVPDQRWQLANQGVVAFTNIAMTLLTFGMGMMPMGSAASGSLEANMDDWEVIGTETQGYTQYLGILDTSWETGPHTPDEGVTPGTHVGEFYDHEGHKVESSDKAGDLYYVPNPNGGYNVYQGHDVTTTTYGHPKVWKSAPQWRTKRKFWKPWEEDPVDMLPYGEHMVHQDLNYNYWSQPPIACSLAPGRPHIDCNGVPAPG